MIDVPQQAPLGIEFSARSKEQKKRAVELSKMGILIVLTVGSAFVLGQYLSYSFFKNFFSVVTIAIPLVISFAVFLTFFFHTVLFVQKKGILLMVAILSGVALAVNFFSFTNTPILIGIILCVLLLVYAAYTTKRELEARIKVQFIRGLNSITTKVVLAVAILLALAFYGTLTTQKLDENNIFLPRSVFSALIPIVQGPLQGILGNIDVTQSVRQIAEQKVDEAITQQVGSEEKGFVPATIRKQLVATYIEELQKGFSGIVGGESVNPDQPLTDAIYDGLLEKFNTMDPTIKSWTLLGLVVLFIFSIQALAIVIRIVLIPVAFIVYELLLRTKFAHIVYENASKEIVTL